MLQACDRLSQSERETVRDLLGETPPQTQLSSRADALFLPGTTSMGSNSPSGSNGVKLTISCLCHQCGLNPLLPEIALDGSYTNDHLRSYLSCFHWATLAELLFHLLAVPVEVNPWLDLTLSLKAGCSSTGLTG